MQAKKSADFACDLRTLASAQAKLHLPGHVTVNTSPDISLRFLLRPETPSLRNLVKYPGWYSRKSAMDLERFSGEEKNVLPVAAAVLLTMRLRTWPGGAPLYVLMAGAYAV